MAIDGGYFVESRLCAHAGTPGAGDGGVWPRSEAMGLGRRGGDGSGGCLDLVLVVLREVGGSSYGIVALQEVV